MKSRSINLFIPFAALLLIVGSIAAEGADAPTTAERNPDFQRIQDQLFSWLTKAPPDVQNLLKSLTPEGSWADVEYDSKVPGGWPPHRHMKQVVELAKAYASPASPLHHDAKLKDAIQRALNYWFARDLRSPNWFHNEIRIPQYMGDILILLNNDLTPDEREKAMKVLSQSPYGKHTGQNRVWVAGNILVRGILQNDRKTAEKAAVVISENVVLSEGEEGLKADFTYHLHGPQLQNGNYGLAFAGDVLKWLNVLRGTPLAFPPEKAELMRNYLLLGLGRVIWQNQMDISSCGRQLGPGAPAEKAAAVNAILKEMAEADPEHAGEYRRLAASNDGTAKPEERVTGARMYWASDYAVDRRSDYYTSVRMNSLRTRASENTNYENVNGGFLGDGALFLYRNGREYEDIFPVWNWRKIPGVTSIAGSQTIPTGPFKPRNQGEFVGGVSDGVSGVAAMDLTMTTKLTLPETRQAEFRARKSWFFFPGQIVALGAGISSGFDQGKNLVTTTVNQSLLSGPVLAASGGAVTPVPTRQEMANLEWVWHDQVGYYFPEPVTATVGGATQKGSWQNYARSGSRDPVEKEVFAAWIDHGTAPKDARYAYVVLPNRSEKEMETYAQNPEVKVLSNTPNLQAAQAAQTTGAVFYAASELEYAPGKKLMVDQPCVVLLQAGPGEPKVTVADPTQKLAELTVTLNSKPAKVTLPQGQLAGSSVAAAF